MTAFAPADEHDVLLEIHELVKSFGGPRVLDGVDFTVRAGEVHALLGANGAGKSTLIKIISGLYPPDAGLVTIDVDRRRSRVPVAFVHQDLGLIESATVAENIALACGFPRRGGLISWREVRKRAASVLATLGCELPVDAVVSSLGRTERSLIALSRAVVMEPALLVLDEPTASLPATDVQVLFDVIRRLKASGVGIIYVSHRLDEIFAISDRVTVLRDGKVAGSGRTPSVTIEELVRLIVGGELRPAAVTSGGPSGAVRLAVRDLMVSGIGPVSFDVGRGEIVALAGLRGSGQESVGRALAGALAWSGGNASVDGRSVRVTNPLAARSAGIGFATSRREEESLATTLTVGENVLLNPGLAGRRGWDVLRQRTERGHAHRLLQRFQVEPAEPANSVATLSGGNQQKVVIGREMHIQPDVLVLEEPTMGVDVRSKAAIHELLLAAADAGCSIIVVSTDTDDITAICNRAIVMRAGRITCEIDRAGLSAERLVRAMSGADAEHQAAG